MTIVITKSGAVFGTISIIGMVFVLIFFILANRADKNGDYEKCRSYLDVICAIVFLTMGIETIALLNMLYP